MDNSIIADKVIILPNGLEHVSEPGASRMNLYHTIYEIFYKKVYYRKGWEIKEDDLIVDIGAHMGVFSLWAIGKAKKGRIIAVEPSNNIESLNKSILHNKLTNIIVLKAAAGGKNGVTKLNVAPHYNSTNHNIEYKLPIVLRALIKLGNRTIHRKFKNAQMVETVRTVSLADLMDDFCKGEKINFLKIDCEGGEYDILRTLPKEYFKRIDKIVLEFHHFHQEHDYKDLIKILEINGFNVNIKRSIVQRLFNIGNIWARKNHTVSNVSMS